MEYTDFSVEDFIKDEYFQKWIIRPDKIVLDFWQKWTDDHPEKKEVVKCATNLMLLICTKNTYQLHHFDGDALWSKILQRKDEIEIDIPQSEFRSKKHRTRGKPPSTQKK